MCLQARDITIGAANNTLPSYVPFNDLPEAVDLSNPFLMQHQEVESPVGPLPPSGSGPGPTPLDTSIQMTIIDDTVTEGRPLFYVMTCSLDVVIWAVFFAPLLTTLCVMDIL
ncbi:hypothetical protein MGG_13182 [Pyricularia oryzae 70-15]|uniref:Uncharacterized protein n=1 Tax=Pyricularia oryzae (strain 70-15 / ATCC MYA-4617 / FGSC 8958) TaxID=242507 RepID=G4N0F5_PYRO7|nr:uncharacterized protein MGG_13182 [Pyricularia oryzae 70-15]KAH8847545.1 hypothetical protein MCOR01_000963 [Pyricularia oryzae]EHA52289.1 hypothetical protein MGG_13182 [Pyricularia oryzae 70-15]KAI6257250.1 hypothetical protein MCOR19_006314 [Pyricularia oryzae]KAI6267783.1 hypothetical protein MCOR26_009524 [Pyricularia oryzae]KAI6305830.1 hypothetical protein MCOR29_010357 [Pyricularia oryzae]